ncbi:TetR-like C-terminal domain-containing protein [Asticcacaulis sp. 201]|uniref:TetR/AcrR family transcriptional regulator n=1 Tax=Asticcacaulis sp. 201 TaxID=3028787 RepID=UPI002916D670|nr:TetR-like C-terminal domain-containing protein [Asticcacaulis sp. 201]MDV6331812.1 TetR-like C-terminal domain-containing protein [Asticcacaulis sp. 201]
MATKTALTPPKAAISATTADRRQAQLEALIAAAEKRICESGTLSLKARDLAADIGVALGGLYNIVQDMDALLLLVSSRTLARLGEAAQTATGHLPMTTRAEAIERLVAVAHTYLAFARENLPLWRMIFELRLDSPLPDWAAQDQLRLFRHIGEPLHVIMPDLDTLALTVRARTLFAAVHGIISIGLEERLIAVPPQKLADEIAWLTRAACQ